MAQSTGDVFSAHGMPYPQAVALVAQIDPLSGNAAALTNVGFPPPVAAELAAQITAGGSPPTGAAARLVAVGVSPGLATAIVAAIAASV